MRWNLERKNISDWLYTLNADDFKCMVLDRLRGEEEIDLVCYPHVDDTNNYIDVAFILTKSPEPRDTFYTHFYLGDIEKYVGYKLGKGI